MESGELHARTRLVGQMYAAMSRPVSDAQIAGVVSATQDIPVGWLGASCGEIAKTWEAGHQHPGAADVRRVAARRAGFRRRYNPWVDSQDPEPQWWPAFPQPVPAALAETWDKAPEALQLPRGKEKAVKRLDLAEGEGA